MSTRNPVGNLTFPSLVRRLMCHVLRQLTLHFLPHGSHLSKKSVQDVSEIIQLAASNNLHVAARSGGVSIFFIKMFGCLKLFFSTPRIAILRMLSAERMAADLQKTKQITINSATNIATIEAGNRLAMETLLWH